MFQNIQGQASFGDEYEETDYKENKIKRFLKTAITPQKILIYIASFMLSTIECASGVAPFAIAIFAACFSNRVPVLIVYVLTLLGSFIGLGGSSTLMYLLTSLVFIVMTLIFKPKEGLEYENERLKLGKYVFISAFLVQVSKIFFGNFMVYDLLMSAMVAISSYIFYKIFANSIIVINEFGKKKAFAIEEVIGASILLAICASSFRGFAIFGFELRTILSILVVLVLGWKNGVLVGATSGITIGTILGLIGQDDPIMIASYALSGMIAGIFSRFGKFGVIIGFILGNAILTYVTNGNTASIIYFKEILIASLGLLLVPETIQIDIEELFGKAKLLQSGPASRIEENKETVYRLNNVSETIADIADTYKEAAATIVEDEEIEQKENQKIFVDELLANMDGFEDNILYEDIQNIENSEVLTDVFKLLIENQKITRKDLLDIFASHNNYIVGFDNAEVSMQLEKDIEKIVNVINESYRISKVNFIWKHKMDENKKTMVNQLDGVSKVISSLANDMEKREKEENEFIIEKEEILKIAKERKIDMKDVKIRREKTGRYIINVYVDSCCEENEKRGCTIEAVEKILSKVLEDKIVIQKNNCGQKKETNLCVNTYASQDRYMLQLGISRKTKEGSPISGDTSSSLKLEDGKYLLAISDGMGTGPKARQSSKIAIKMLERLLSNGFDKDSSIELINSTLSSVNSGEDDTYATLDIAILDLYAGNIEFIKNGACPTYIKQNGKVQIIKALSLPAGILENISLVVYDKDIENNDILVMCSDGIMESNAEYQNKELWVRDILESIETDNVQKIADIITKEAIDNGYGQVKDDMTIIVAKMIKR
ncbi:MAG: SpoIIE family protein phosphatase [Clostridia bacterium]|nr:SpoIIE family protein phosphatase [Clostridia bacterium]